MSADRRQTLRQAQGSLTASGKERALVEFYAQLGRDAAARPAVFAGTVTDLAGQARIGRTTLTLMLNGARSGRQSWKHVLPHLSVEALFRLKQCSAWNTHAERALEWMIRFPVKIDRLESDFGQVRLRSTLSP